MQRWIDFTKMVPDFYLFFRLRGKAPPTQCHYAKAYSAMNCVGILEQPMGARNRVGIGLSYRPSRTLFADLFRRPGIDFQPGGPVRQPYFSYRPVTLHRLAKSIPRNRFLGSINVYKYGLWLHRLAESVLGIDSWAPYKFENTVCRPSL